MGAETITFYSYKGGTGRSLVVSHVANYLCSFGKRVVAIDFDLEAPGLHYKLRLTDGKPHLQPERGLLDLMFESLKRGAPLPSSLDEYIPLIAEDNGSGGWIRLLAAGNTDSSEYWGRLAQINWHDTFYALDGFGIPFFLELMRRVETEFEPDYILIDSRTGVTEIGGVATSILPDRLVCLFTNSTESLQGTRNVIRSVAVAPRLPTKRGIDILPVLTRLPEVEKDVEQQISESALAYLNETTDRPEATLRLGEILILHSEPSLQVHEKLMTAGNVEDTEPPLLRDYLKLFSRLVPPEVVEPHMGRLVDNALRRVMDDPDGVQKDLETLARFYPHQASVRALLKFYRLRKAPVDVILRTAVRLFQLTQDRRDPYLQETVLTYAERGKELKDRDVIELVNAIWSERNDPSLGFALLEAYGKKPRAREIVMALLDMPDLRPERVPTLIWAAIQNDLADEIVHRAHRLAQDYADQPLVVSSLARLLAQRVSATEAMRVIERASVDWVVLRRHDPSLLVQVLNGIGDTKARDRETVEVLSTFEEYRDRRPLAAGLADVYAKAGELEKLYSLVETYMSEPAAREVRYYLENARRQ